MRATPQLMFQGAMGDAIALWRQAFPEVTVRILDGDEAKPVRAQVTIAGQDLYLFDSPSVHDFGFTPAISLVIECDEAAEVNRLAAVLGEGGHVFMPLGAYDFAPRYVWLADRFGVSWQIMTVA